MSINKFQELTKIKSEDKLCGLCLKNGEKKRLFDICNKYHIPITYPSLFKDDICYHLWGIRKTGIGLIGTNIMNYLKANNGIIFYSLDELEKHLKELN